MGFDPSQSPTFKKCRILLDPREILEVPATPGTITDPRDASLSVTSGHRLKTHRVWGPTDLGSDPSQPTSQPADLQRVTEPSGGSLLHPWRSHTPHPWGWGHTSWRWGRMEVVSLMTTAPCPWLGMENRGARLRLSASHGRGPFCKCTCWSLPAPPPPRYFI